MHIPIQYPNRPIVPLSSAEKPEPKSFQKKPQQLSQPIIVANKKKTKPSAAIDPLVQQPSEKPADQQAASSAAAAANSATKKKTKYVNLYSQDGQMRGDVVLLKGRHMCNCQATKHKLVNNCIKCGRIVCEQEASGPCLFCGHLVCSEEEQRCIESASKKGETLKRALMQQNRPKGWDEAMAMRNKLLEYNRSSEKRTIVIDDESDYFKANSVWLSDTERKKLQRLEKEIDERKHASRRTQKVTLDFTGRQVIEEPQLAIDVEDEVLREIAESTKIIAGIRHTMIKERRAKGDADDNNGGGDDIHPFLEGPTPVFDESVVDRSYARALRHKPDNGQPQYDGVYNRVQDKELLEISDLRSCISMHQPWASLLVAGIKKHEGRSWYASHRGRLWIAATAKPVERQEIEMMETFYRRHYKGIARAKDAPHPVCIVITEDFLCRFHR